MPAITPYLYLNGRCEEAMSFYAKALGAHTVMSMRFNESPDPMPEGMLPPGFEAKIMHATIMIGDTPLMMADGCSTTAKHDGVSISLAYDTAAEAQKAFDGLAAGGGTVIMPICETFWSPCFGMVTDQFGVGWMVTIKAMKM
jgi:PhnB protein